MNRRKPKTRNELSGEEHQTHRNVDAAKIFQALSMGKYSDDQN
jgi:hypothetical protein